MSYQKAVESHYEQLDLDSRILAALHEAGKNVDVLTREDLSAFDEFHSGGIEATRRLARLAGLRQGMRVLDVGSGIGGPARTLAAEFGCQVTGVDLTEEFCKAAEMLNTRLGLSDKVSIRHGSALELPFDDSSFDAIWTQNVLMNIEDKNRAFSQMYRVLRSGGRLAFQAYMTGPNPEMRFPVMWASGPHLNFLTTSQEFRDMLNQAGFKELVWKDVTELSLEGSRNRLIIALEKGLPLLSTSLLVQDDIMEKMANAQQNLEEGATIPVNAVFERV